MPTPNGFRPNDLISMRLRESASIKESMQQDSELVDVIEAIANTIADTFRRGNKILLCGNGGSSSDASHIAAELVGRFYSERKALPAFSLTDNASTVTAIGNDYSFEEIYARQVSGMGQPGDTLIGLSTSGNSENVVRALHVAKELGMATIAFTGSSGGKLLDISDVCLRVPSDDTARIQEAHITAAHIVCELVENSLPKDRE